MKRGILIYDDETQKKLNNLESELKKLIEDANNCTELKDKNILKDKSNKIINEILYIKSTVNPIDIIEQKL